MDTAQEIDQAKDEAPAQEVFETSLGSTNLVLKASQNQSQSGRPRRLEEGSQNGGRSSSRGSFVTTTQPKLQTILISPKTLQDDEGRSPESVRATLLPMDEGFGAWSYVAAAFSMYIVVWGFPQSFPMFATYLSKGQFAEHKQSMALTLLAPGIQDIEEGIIFHILPKASKYRPLLVRCGISIIVLSLLMASWADSPVQVLLTQGVLFGVGGILLKFVHVSVYSEWFDKRKGQAMGIIWLGYRAGSLAFPLICQALLDRHGYQRTLQVLIAPMLTLLLPCTLSLRGRYPASSAYTVPSVSRVSRLTALRKPKVLYYIIVALSFDIVLNVPKMFLMMFGADLGLPAWDQAVALSTHQLTLMVGTYGLSLFSNKVNWRRTVVLMSVTTSATHFLIWGFAKDRKTLLAYAAASGLAMGGYRNAMFPFYTEVAGADGELFTAVHGLFSFFSGSAILSVGPVGYRILRLSPELDINAFSIGRYKYLVTYAGSSSLFGGILVALDIMLRR